MTRYMTFRRAAAGATALAQSAVEVASLGRVDQARAWQPLDARAVSLHDLMAFAEEILGSKGWPISSQSLVYRAEQSEHQAPPPLPLNAIGSSAHLILALYAALEHLFEVEHLPFEEIWAAGAYTTRLNARMFTGVEPITAGLALLDRAITERPEATRLFIAPYSSDAHELKAFAERHEGAEYMEFRHGDELTVSPEGGPRVLLLALQEGNKHFMALCKALKELSEQSMTAHYPDLQGGTRRYAFSAGGAPTMQGASGSSDVSGTLLIHPEKAGGGREASRRSTPSPLINARYERGKLLGEGGFASVYEARDLQLDRRVAIKILNLNMASRSAQRLRFQREAKLIANLKHPHIVNVSETGFIEADDASRPYIVMDLIEGVDLEAALEQHGPLEPERAIALMLQALDALSYVHRHGIVHRDIKPANFLLAASQSLGSTEHLYLMDFGIALSDQLSQERLTQDYTLGTPNYLPREYIRERTVSPQLDIYQIGMTLCELLTGETLIEQRGMSALIKIAELEHITLPEHLDGTPLGEVLAKALSVDPDGRYDSAEAMHDALAAIDPSAVILPLERRATEPFGPPVTPPPRMPPVTPPSPEEGRKERSETSDVAWKAPAALSGQLTAAWERPEGATIKTKPSAGVAPRFSWHVVALGATIVALGGAGFYLAVLLSRPDMKRPVEVPEARQGALLTEPPSIDPPEAPLVVVQDAPVAEAPEVEAPEVLERVITIESAPEGASIYRGEELLGTTPMDVGPILIKERAPVTLRLSKRGYIAQELTTSEEKSAYRIELRREKQPPPRSRPSRPAASGAEKVNTPKAPSTPEVEPEPEAEPKSKRRDYLPMPTSHR